MKNGSCKVLAVFVLLAGVSLAAFGDELTVSLESRIVENFDNAEDSLYVWKKDASRYAVGKDPADKDSPSFAGLGLEGGDFFPKLDYKIGWPMALFKTNKDNKDLKVLGIWGKFKRMGYNWVDVYPVLRSEGDSAGPYEIPLPGRVRYLDMWVWGSNLNYYIEAFLRDERGVVHTIPMGGINFKGWKNIRASIPNNVPQQRQIILDPTATNATPAGDRSLIFLKFVKFRIWTTPIEEVGNFYVYFDQFKILTDTFETLFDGDELSDPDWVRENWTGGGASGASNAGNTGAANAGN